MADKDAIRLRDLVARQLDGDPDASETRIVPVQFRRSGDQVDVTLRRLRPSERRQSQSYAVFDSEGHGDMVYRLGVAAVRFGAIDAAGVHEFRSYADVVAFEDAITDASWNALGQAMTALKPADEPIATAEDPEAGKDC